MLTTSRRVVFGALFLSSGAALLIYVLSGISLAAAIITVFALALVLGAMVWRRSGDRGQAVLFRSLRVGFVSGLLATGAYDLARFLLIITTGIAFWPFDIFTIFGQALVGPELQSPWVTAVGVGYHFANGVGFAIAYTVWLGRHGIWTGIAWAFVLEILMVSIYPGWLGLKALNEFLQVSIFGHIVYGSVLGYTARRLLTKPVEHLYGSTRPCRSG